MKNIASVLLLAAVANPAFAEEAVTVTTNNAAPVAATPAVSATEAAPVIATPAAEPAAEAKAVVSAPATELVTEASPVVSVVKGYYATADLGMVNYSNTASAYDKSALPNPLVLQLAGGYRYNQYWAAEAGYSLIGDSVTKSTGTVVLNETLKNKVVHIAAVGTYTISSKFDVFGKLGLANTAFDYTYSRSTQVATSGSGSATKTNLMFGLGAQYNINKRYNIHAQYENFGSTTVTNTFSNGTTASANIGISVITVGGTYNF
jgi:opacity protein-like surface antigen